MTRVLLIQAGPTPWDIEGRLGGRHSLPLQPEARVWIQNTIDQLPHPPVVVYRAKRNEACDETAKLIATKFNLRPRDHADLDEIDVGLWQGLTRNELRSRFPKAFVQWERHPAAVNPPDGEPLTDAFHRLAGALRSIGWRNRETTIAIALRPMSMRVAAGILIGESLDQIAEHLHEAAPLETIELDADALKRVAGK
ncbi:MAG: histidine phosphatase family protein [Anaerolineae bacterium]|nr:histidine phosphatase family protein [Phycisphaerae bacterium]